MVADVTARFRRLPPAAIAVLLLLALAVIFGSMAQFALVDADEGIYLLNARLVIEGQIPYRDFHYPQMPLLPYLYGGWMTLMGVSWHAGRWLSTILAVALGLCVYHHTTAVTGRRAWGGLAAAVLGLNGLAFSWYPLVKTYAFATLVLFLAYTLVERGSRRSHALASGALLGLAVDTRLYLVAIVPLFAFAFLRRGGARSAAALLAGCALALAPNAYFLWTDARRYVFNVVGHHALRSDAGLVGAFAQKLETALAMVSVTEAFDPASFQFTLLLIATVSLVALLRARSLSIPWSTTTAGLLMLVSLLPTPTYTQYFCMVVPFLAVDLARFTALAAQELRATPDRGSLVRRAPYVLGAGLGLYALVAPLSVYSLTAGAGGQDLKLSADWEIRSARNWSIAAITQVSHAIDEAMPQGARTAISWWPGYFVESRTGILPRLENPYALWFSMKLTPEQVARYGFIHPAELVSTIRAHQVPVVVLGNWLFGARPYFRNVVETSGYVMVRRLGDTEIYRWTPR